MDISLIFDPLPGVMTSVKEKISWGQLGYEYCCTVRTVRSALVELIGR